MQAWSLISDTSGAVSGSTGVASSAASTVASGVSSAASEVVEQASMVASSSQGVSTAGVGMLGAALLLALTVWLARRRLQRGGRLELGTIAWSLVFVVLLLVVGVGSLTGLFDTTAADDGLCALAIFGCGVVAALRSRLLGLVDSLPEAARRAVRPCFALLAILCVSIIGFVAIELPWNENVEMLSVSSALYSCTLLTLASVALYAVCQRNGVGIAVVSATCCILGIAQYFVLEFKGAAILPSDMLALGTAAAVSGAYEYVLDAACLVSITLTCVPLALCSLVREGRGVAVAGAATVGTDAVPEPEGTSAAASTATGVRCWFAELPGRLRRWASVPELPRRVAAGFVNVALGAALIAIMLGSSSAVKVTDVLDFVVDAWQPITTYRAQGFIPSFVAMVQDLPIAEPDGYSAAAARADEVALVVRYEETMGASETYAAASAAYEQVQPTIIAIMCESYSDLSIFDGLGTGYATPSRAGTLAGVLAQGELSVSVNGGGTCNSEFEFLTGNSLAFVGNGKYPYQLYDFSDVQTLPRQLKEAGYATTAIHPENPSNWNRSRVYAEMGFDEFYSIGDFADSDERLHAGVSDAAAYDKVLEVLAADDSPQFVFEVTMQNHSGYDAIDLPEELLEAGYTQGDLLGEPLSTWTTEYLSLMAESDRALEEFLGELATLDRPVAVVFFGDHQPFFSSQLNDLYFGGEEDSLAHSERLYRTRYLTWANYDVDGAVDAAGMVDEAAAADAGAETDVAVEEGGSFEAAGVADAGEAPALDSSEGEAGDQPVGDVAGEGVFEAVTDDGAAADDGVAEESLEGFSFDVYESEAVQEAGIQQNVGLSTLAARLLYSLGVPLTSYQKAQLGASQDVAVLNLAGYRGADGVFYELDADSPYVATIAMWRNVQYLNFATKVQ